MPFKLFPSRPPTATLSTDKTNYNAGDTVHITVKPTISTPDTAYHDEAVWVTGPNGYNSGYLTWDSVGLINADGSVTSEGTNIAAAKGTDFPYYGQATSTLQTVYGGASQWGNSQTYQELSTLSTSCFPQGVYTVHYVLYDAIGR